MHTWCLSQWSDWRLRSYTKRLELNELLLSLFSADELRRFLCLNLGTEGRELVQALPGQTASAATIVYEAVQALERRGLIGDEFFDALVAERPRREGDIRRVQEGFLGN